MFITVLEISYLVTDVLRWVMTVWNKLLVGVMSHAVCDFLFFKSSVSNMYLAIPSCAQET